MCSNTSLSSGCNDHSGDKVAHRDHVIYSKKPKRPRVPKRGPGVAELEKILREQENKNHDLFQTKNEGFSLFSPIPKSPIHLPSFNSPSKPDPLSATDPERFSPSKIALNQDSDTSNKPLRVNNVTVKKSVQIGGSRILLPEHTLLPTIWNSSEHITNSVEGSKSFSGSNQQFSPPHLMQRVQYSPPSIMHVFPHSAMSSAATSSIAAGLRDSCVEPPSNQTTYPHFNSFWPDEDKMVGTKRSRPFSMDMPDIPTFRWPVPAFSHPMNRIDSSLPFLINVPSTDAVSRDLKMDGSLQPNSRKRNKEYGEKHIASQLERFSSNHIPFQDMKESEEVSQETAASGDQSVEKKPLYSFSHKKDETNFNLNDKADDAEEDAIDLNLKL